MKKIRKYFIALFFACLCVSYIQAKTIYSDSLKRHYPISDPRNPDCPCHKYQKMADKEFKKYQEQKSATTTNFLVEGNTGFSSSGSKKRQNNYFFIFKNKNTAKAIRTKQLKKSLVRRKKLWRKKSTIDACKHW